MARAQRSLPDRRANPVALGQSYYYNAVPSVGMDMDAPYRLYVNGRSVAEYDDEATAAEHFLRLRAQMRQAPRSFAGDRL